MWIEIARVNAAAQCVTVTPYAGVWIEISEFGASQIASESLPTRECGLKSSGFSSDASTVIVTPYAGVWIEMYPFR